MREDRHNHDTDPITATRLAIGVRATDRCKMTGANQRTTESQRRKESQMAKAANQSQLQVLSYNGCLDNPTLPLSHNRLDLRHPKSPENR